MPSNRSAFARWSLVSSYLFSAFVAAGCGDVAAPISTRPSSAGGTSSGSANERSGWVSVFWSPFDYPASGRVSASAGFIETGGCSTSDFGPCQETVCTNTVTSFSAGKIQIRGRDSALELDMALSDGNYLAQGTGGAVPPASMGALVDVSAAGTAEVPAFDATVSYPSLLVLTSPPVDDPEAAPAVPSMRVSVPREQTTVFTWERGAADVRFRVEGTVLESPTQSSRHVACEAPSLDGTMTVPAGILRGLTLRAFTVGTRQVHAGDWNVDVGLGGPVLVRLRDGLLVADLGGG